MKTISLKRTIFDVLTFVIVWAAIQFVGTFLMTLIYSSTTHTPVADLYAAMGKGQNAQLIIASSCVSSVLTGLLFTLVKWTPLSRTYLKSRPWAVLCWTVTLALGTLLPLEWSYEQLNVVMSEIYKNIFSGVMREPLGYLAVALLAPLVEEMVFRGAILRVLLRYCGDRRHWIAIAISALIFGLVHGNVAQGIHATLVGLLLGWLYYRSGSIVPGIVYHWVNNTVSFCITFLFPELEDAKLLDFFQGSQLSLALGLVFSLCVFLPSLYQLALRLKRDKADDFWAKKVRKA